MPNRFHAAFYGRREVPGLERITLKQKYGNHTLMMLDYNITSNRDYLLPPENSPVLTEYGRGVGQRTRGYGYVNHYETAVGSDSRTYTRMVAVGTSKVMNSVVPTSWTGYTRSGIAREIATRHRLRSVVHNHPAVLDNWSTGNRTDFQSLKALAQETGYRLWVDGSTLWFLDPTQVVRSAAEASTPRVSRRQQRDVQVLGGSNIPGEMEATKRQVQYGVDSRTNEVFMATNGDTSLPVELVGDVVDNYADAGYNALASSRKQQDQYVLKATIDGDTRVHPGAVINVEAGRVNTDQMGLWVVSEAVHEVSAKDYTTTLVATRSDLDNRALSRIPNAIRTTGGSTEAVVRNGRVWEAALQERIYV